MWRKIGLKSESPNKELSAQFSKRTQSKSQLMLNKSQANKSGLQNSRILSVQVIKGSQEARPNQEQTKCGQQQPEAIKIEECREQRREESQERCSLGKQFSQIRFSSEEMRGSLQLPQLDRRSSLLQQQNSRLKKYVQEIQNINFQLSSRQASLLQQLALLQAAQQTHLSRHAQSQSQVLIQQTQMQALHSNRLALQAENSEFSCKLEELARLNDSLKQQLSQANLKLEDLKMQRQSELAKASQKVQSSLDTCNKDKILQQQIIMLRQSLSLESAAKIALQTQLSQSRQLNRSLQTQNYTLKQNNQKQRLRQSRVDIVLKRSLLLLSSFKVQMSELKASLANQSKAINKHLYYCTAQIWLRLQQLANQLSPHDFLMRSRVVMLSPPACQPPQRVPQIPIYDFPKVPSLSNTPPSPQKPQLRFGLKQDYNMSSRVNLLIQKYKRTQIT